MAVIIVNGAALPTPSAIRVGVQDISKSERNTRGTMIKEHIATKQKLEFQWKYMSAEDLATVLAAVSGNFFEVTYIDPTTGLERTGTFYSGDRDAGYMDVRDGVIRYKEVKFNIIER